MSWEINNHIANGIALGASLLTIIMWLAPVRDVWSAPYSIFRLKNTDSVATGFGFVAGTFNCILWNRKFFKNCPDEKMDEKFGQTIDQAWEES
jgi:hypothetical protein